MAVDFESLYYIYNANKMVIITGSEVLRIKDEDVSFEQKAIEKFTGIAYKEGPQTFSDLAIKLPATNISSSKLIGVYNEYNDNNAFDVNLMQLIAGLSKVKLFIQTSFDTKLNENLGNTEEIVWNHKIREPLYLNIKNGKKKLFYLFGNVNEGVSVYEEEQTDCLLNLQIYNEVNKSKLEDHCSFLEYLKDKTLVFIGNNFPDWFMRLLIRTLYNGPMTNEPNKAYIINDSRRNVNFERYFFDKFKIELVHDYPIEDFLRKLTDKISNTAAFENWYPPRKVFICYDRAQRLQADEIKKRLGTKHIEAFLDISDMGIADHQKKVKGLILAPDTCMIICLLSATLANKADAESYTKRIEWDAARARVTLNNYYDTVPGAGPHPPFIVTPVAVDDYNQYMQALPAFITDSNILNYEPGAVADLIEQQVKAITYEYK